MTAKKVVRRHSPITTTKVERRMSLREWVRFFFIYAMAHHRSFYWQREDGTLIVASTTNKQTYYNVGLQIDLISPPLQHQFEPPLTTSMLPFLMEIYDQSPKSLFLAVRNHQASVRQLSFYSFLLMIKDDDENALPSCTTKTDRRHKLYSRKELIDALLQQQK
jgi:hypothetical protein